MPKVGGKKKPARNKNKTEQVKRELEFKEDGQEYAQVTKMLGNGMCHVTLLHKDVIHDNIVCHIRGKFRSRNKKSNLVTVGATVLVGIRSWSSNLDACDLLYIYNDNQISSLNLPSSLFQNLHSQPIDNDILFSSNLTSSNNNQLSSISHFDNNNNLNDIDFDDI